ncbi:MAG: nucleotidyltransferase domain-containing protein [bacterium]
MTKEELLNTLKRYFKDKAKAYKVELAFLYGSWARGLPRLDSDVDVAVVFSRSVPTSETFSLLTDLSLDLSAFIGKEVNIINISPDFHKPMLYYNAIILGRPVYIESTDRYARFFVDAICQMEDFSLFGTKWQVRAAQKNLAEAGKNG